jgi:hypothetical protein
MSNKRFPIKYKKSRDALTEVHALIPAHSSLHLLFF